MTVDLSGVYYKIAWTGSNEIAVVCVQDFDLSDYNFASREDFATEEEAATYAVDLARRNGLCFEGGFKGYLD
jgi:hypothetical protein